MMNVRYREKTNTWPGFVDLFSNLVIILIFLLIVFVFLWTTTGVFNKNTDGETVAGLKQANAELTERVQQLTSNEQEANDLLLQAKAVLDNFQSVTAQYEARVAQLQQSANTEQETLKQQIAQLAQERQDLQSAKDTFQAAAQAEIQTLQERASAQQQELQAKIDDLTQQLTAVTLNQQQTDALDQERRNLQDQMDAQRASLSEQLANLQKALDAAEEKSREQEIQYVEMSNRLNKALADKVAELNAMTQYQSAFYKAIKNALGNRTSVQPDGDRFIISSDILFGSGSYALSAEGKNQLRLIANVIKDFENQIPTDIKWIIRVDGHTDKKPVVAGTRGYKNNIELSLLRATAVANELAAAGVSKRRLVPSGFGDMHPASLGDDVESLQKNRRIELQLTNQ